MPAALAIPDLDAKKKGRTEVKRIEAFAAGPWNYSKYGKVWTAADLASMVEAFEPTLEDVIPVVTSNHDEDDHAGETRGFITRLYTNEQPFTDDAGRKAEAGSRLFLDALIDEDLVAEMKAGKFNRPSLEIATDYQDLSIPAKVWPFVVTAASMIGGKLQPAVRVTKPLVRVLAHQFGSRLPLHFREGTGDRLTVRFDAQQEVFMDPEVMKILQQLVAGQEAILAALPKTAPAPDGEMQSPPTAEMAEGAPAPAPAPAVAPVAAPTHLPAAPIIPTSPSSVTLKYSEQDPTVDALKERIQALELENAVTRAAARKLQERDQVRAQVQKFSEPGNMRIAPAQVEAFTDLALAIPAGDSKLKFSDGAGKVADMSPREAFFAQLGARPDQTKLMRPQLVHLNRPPSSAGVLAFAEQAKETAKTKGISEQAAIQSQLDEITDVNELHALVFGQEHNGNGSNNGTEG